MKHLDRKGRRSKVEALLELDFDDFRGTRQSTRSYARLWGWHRTTVDRLIAEYDAHRQDLESANARGNPTAGDRANERPRSGHPNGHQSAIESDTSPAGAATRAATERPPDAPRSGRILEQDQEPEGERRAPRSPAASQKETKAEIIEAAVAKLGVQSEHRNTAKARAEVVAAALSAAANRLESDALATFVRTTWDIPNRFLGPALDEAIKKSERGFLDVRPVLEEAKRLGVKARKAKAARQRLSATANGAS